MAPDTAAHVSPRDVTSLVGVDNVGAAGGDTTWMAKLPETDQVPAASRS